MFTGFNLSSRSRRGLLIVVCFALLAGCSGERQDFQRAEAAGTVAAWEEFLVRHPDGERAADARARLATLHEEREWKRAATVDSIDAYQQYLRGYPNGHYASEALIRIANLNLASTPAGGPDESAAPAETPVAPLKSAAATQAKPVAPKSVAPGPVATQPTTPAVAAAKSPTRPAVVAPAKPAAPAASGAWRVQLGAFARGSVAAERAWERLLKKYPGDFAGHKPIIAAARGRDGKALHRLQVAGYSAGGARELCARLTANGDPCVIVKPANK